MDGYAGEKVRRQGEDLGGPVTMKLVQSASLIQVFVEEKGPFILLAHDSSSRGCKLSGLLVDGFDAYR